MAKKPPPSSPPAFANPFAKLGSMRDGLPPGDRPAPEKPKAGPARAVVRLERKGRGGKEVTVVEKLGLPPAERERWLKELKNALGCGGVVEDEDLVLQGDQRDRVRDVLLARGVGKVTLG